MGVSQGRGAGSRDGLASRPHQQLSFRTLCSSEALARDRTIFRVSFMAAGRGTPDPGRALDPPATGRISARWRRVSREREPRRQGRVLQAHWPPGKRGGAARAQWGLRGLRSPPWPRPLPQWLRPSRRGSAPSRCAGRASSCACAVWGRRVVTWFCGDGRKRSCPVLSPTLTS